MRLSTIAILTLLFALVAASCSTMLSEDEYAKYQVQSAQLDSARADYEGAAATIIDLQNEIGKLRDELAKPDADVDAINASILSLTTDLATALTTSTLATAKVEEAAAAIKALEEENDYPDWMLIGEAVLASIFGVRLTRGPASKGPLVNVPFLGGGDNPPAT